MRFFTVGNDMSDTQARYFTEVDQRDHVAWCGVEPVRNGRGYGIARFVRDAAQPTRADFAIAVIDDMQGRGLGTILLAALYVLAQAGGIEELHGEFLPGNPVTPLWLPRLGAEIDGGDPYCGVIRWRIGREDAFASDLPQGHGLFAWVARLRPLVLAGHGSPPRI
jgi:GNAT superfamily N-acetyltransferase